MEKIEMKTNFKKSLLGKGIKILFKELGTVNTIKFLQEICANKGNSVKEIESITEKLSREQALSLIKKTEERLTKGAKQRLEAARKTPIFKYVKL